MKKIFLSLLLAFSFSVNAQSDFCGFDSLMLSWRNADPAGYNASRNAHHTNIAAYRAAHPYINHMLTPSAPMGYSLVGGNNCPDVNYILPVVVHIIHLAAHSSQGIGSNIRNSQVDSQMLALNRAYRNYLGTASPAVNTGIQFCLANKNPDGTAFNGITRTASSRSITRRPQLDSLIALIQYPTDRYINVYVVSTILDSAGSDNGILGYATYPYSTSRKKDAIVIRHTWFGMYHGYAPLNSLADGKVLVHEMGHYLGLYHPFYEGCSGLHASDCHTIGDLCCDVPAVITDNTSCSVQNTCTETYNSNPFDQKENYMDYTTPSCKTTFTRDQANIMYSVLESTRSSLWDPVNINKLSLSCCMNNARFSGMDFGCKTDSLHYTAYLYDSATYTWYLYRKDTLRNTYYSTNGKLDIKLDTGQYVLQLQIDASNGRFTYRFPHTIRVVDCSNPIKSTKGNWYFGQYAGIRFFVGGKVFRDLNPYTEYKIYNNPQINVYEGTISMSDTAGKMLFYGGPEAGIPDIIVFDKNYQTMTGSPLEGDFSASQGMITIQHSKKPYIHYLFHTSTILPSFKFSKIDLSQIGSTQGALVNKNVEIKDSGAVDLDNIYEAITALTGCNDSTYWIIIAKAYPASLLIYQFVNGSLSYHSSFQPFNSFSRDKIRFSPNGTMFSYGRYICSFDRSNAQIKKLHYDSTISQVYDAVFSDDSKLLYRSENTNASQNNFAIYQLDMESKNPNETKVMISPAIVSRQSLQMGPNGKIYITNIAKKYLSVINSPSLRQFNGNNCGYEDVGVTLGSEGQDIQSWEGLPNFIDAKEQAAIAPDFLSRPTTCKTIEFLSNQCCQSTYKWYFGDGDSSTTKNPSHAYADTGTYIITMKAGSLTKKDTIHVGIPKNDLTIFGDTILCQSGVKQYSAKLSPNYISYTWKPVGHSSAYYDRNISEIVWSGAGSLRLVVTDKNGCKDSSSISITIATTITNNTIPPSLAVCDTSVNSIITGSTPSGGAGTFTYRWFYIDQSNVPQIISGATSKDYTATNFPYSTKIYREVTQNNCHHTSNPLILNILAYTNKISLLQAPCKIDTTYIVQGDTAYGAPIDSYINWQYSTNGVDWNYFSIHTQNLEETLSDERIYVRRLIDYTGLCEVASNVIEIVPDVFITQQPLPQYVCSFQDFTFSIEVSNEKNLPLTYWLRHFDSSSNSWTLHLAKGSTFTDYAVYKSTDYIQFIIQTPCGYIYSDIVLLKVRHTGPEIDTDPSNQYINEGDRTNLIGEVFNTYETGLSYNWQYRINTKSYNGVSYSWTPKTPTWQYVTDSIRNKLQFIGGICDDSTEYRFVANNGCNSYSNPARLFMTNMADLWMRDSDNDTGAEPNSGVAGWSNPSKRTFDIFKSPDVFNCSNSPGCNSPQNAEFKNNGDNYIHFKIRNRGLQTSKPARLYLYWTLASTGELWDRHWKSTSEVAWYQNGTWSFPHHNKFNNLDSGQYFPTGGQINSTGILIQPLDTGDIFDSSYAWRPPNPRWYHTTVNGVRKTETKLQICLLARIEYCDQYPHEMEFNELYRVSVDTNVVNNNNIATHNLWVSDSLPQNTPWNNRPPRNTWTRVFQPRENPGPVTIHISDVDPVYDPGVRVIVTMDDSLHQAWVNGGLIGTGFIPLGYQRYELTSSNATFGNIYSDSALVGNIGVEFLPLDTTYLPTDTSYYTLSQTYDENGSYEGGVIFRVDFNSTTNEEGDGLAPFNPSLSLPQEKISKYILYPNPANTKLTVYISSPKNKEHAIVITDFAGRTLITEKCQFLQSDTCSKEIDISRLAAGAYLVRLTSGNETDVKRINILR